MARVKPKIRGLGWTWEFQPQYRGTWVLCNWAEAYKAFLHDDNKPMDGARKVRVELVPTSKRNRKRYGYKS